MRKSLATALILSLTLCVAAWAQMMDSQPMVASQSYSRDFGGGKVGSQFSLRAGGEFEPGQRAWLQVDLDSTAGGEVRAELINGFIVFALPPGMEADGQPRLLFFNEASSRYDYMYSKGYPRLDRLAGADSAFADSASNDPARILNGLAQVSLALDSTVKVIEPASPRLTGADRAYSMTGVSWLLPANVYMKPIVSLFDPEPGLSPSAKLRAVLQVKVTGAVGAQPVEVYAGGLSAAMQELDLLPSQLPPTAMPLAPVPEATAAPAESIASAPVVEQPADQPQPEPEPEPTREGTPIQEPPARSHNSRQPAEPALASLGQDEQTAPAAPAEGTAPPPQPIPALVFSYEWLAWETQWTPSAMPDSVDAAPDQVDPVAPAGETDPIQFDLPEELAPEQLTPVTPIAESATQPEATNDTPPETPEPEPPVERPVRQPDATPEPASGGSSARQVEPGTLPTEPQEYTIPLKEIAGGETAGSSSNGSSEFRLKPADGQTGGGAPDVIAPELPGADMNLPAPEGLGEMILIPAGPFLMGTATGQGGDADEQPQGEVNLPAYYIDKYPVTNRQFHNFVISAGFKPEGNWQKYYGQGTADLPVRGVSLADAQAFAKWAGKRLPTEAEWEKAARGTDGRTYPWGEDWSAEIMPRGDETSLYAVMTAPKTASPFGVMGMSGLVWQWTASPYAPYPFNPDARSEKYVLRGGAFSNGRGVIRCANRYFEPSNVALNTFGFRCVKDAPGA